MALPAVAPTAGLSRVAGRRPDEPLRVLLVARTMHKSSDPVWEHAKAPAALGAFCLRSFVESIPELAARVRIDVRSYPSDAGDALLLEEIRARDPHVVGFTSQPWNYLENLRIARTLARLWPDLAVIHGGPMVVSRRKYLERAGASVSIAVEGEAEETFAELLRHYVFRDRPLESIRGIAFFTAEGVIVETPGRDPPDLAKLPPVMTPSNLADMGSYVLYETARGCPFRCSFCNWGSQRTKLRSRSRDVIDRDLRAILQAGHVQNLWLTDAGLDISTEHITFVADTIRRHRTGKTGVCGYAFLLHQDLGYIAKVASGIDQLIIGLQTANEDSLSEIGRKALSVQRFDRILDAVLPHYPSLRVDLLYGLPNIGPADFRDSVRFLLKKGLWLINLFRLVAIPGTELAENKAKYGLVADEDYPFTVYSADGCSAEDMFEMQQFKVNMDTLRWVVADGGYAKALEAGVDLVDVAAVLHQLIPDLNRRIPYDDYGDWAPSAEVVTSLLDGLDRFPCSEEGRRAVKELVRARHAVFRLDATPQARDAIGVYRAANVVEPTASGAPSAPEPRGTSPAYALRVRDAAGSWTLRVEPLRADQPYFSVVAGNGLYYETRETDGDRRASGALQVLVRLLGQLAERGVSLDDPAIIASWLCKLRVRGLSIEPLTGPTSQRTHVGAPPSVLHLPIVEPP